MEDIFMVGGLIVLFAACLGMMGLVDKLRDSRR